jgi:hypothetical protein
MANVFLIRQKPFNDKVTQTSKMIERFVESHLAKNRISVPYLHNNEIIDVIGATDGIKPSNLLAQLERGPITKSRVIDVNEKTRKNKLTRIKQLVSSINTNSTYGIIPYKRKLIIVEFDNTVYIDELNDLYYSTDKSLCMKDGATNVRTLSFGIKSKRIIDKPSMYLPPVSLQKMDQAILENLVNIG